MSFSAWPLLSRLEGAQSILVAGAGGGFDVFSALPLFLHLRARGKQVHLANLTFTYLGGTQARLIDRHLAEIHADTEGADRYFPERALARWLRSRGEDRPIYAFEKVGGRPLLRAYQSLQRKLGFDAVVLVDGGTDILMRGDEVGLGTPEEDITSLSAAAALEVPEKLLLCLGFGVDRHHGVCHAHFLENVAALTKENAFLGVNALLPEMDEAKAFLEAVTFSREQMPQAPSIVCNSIAAAIEGDYGNVHRTARTEGSTLWINPLMSMYWAFDLMAVARRCLYLPQVAATETIFEVSAAIEAYRNARPSKSWEDIPV